VNTPNFDPRWIFVIFIVLLLVLRGNPYIDIVILLVGAGWALQAGLVPWRGTTSPIGRSKVTYWRGQRIEIQQPAWERVRSISLLQVLVSVIYLAVGLIAAYAAILSFLRLSNIM
jgi:hypothetical protein